MSEVISLPDAAWRQSLRRRLRAWFGRQARDLPWRRTRDPYCIWVSEIMLQQTQVATVVPYYERFLAAFPDVAALAAAAPEDVLRLWEGLGYYRRARQLHQAAQLVDRQHGGRFPRDVDAVRRLPGIGRYTAGAILSIAFDDRQPILEANTTRLLARLLAMREDPATAAAQQTLWQFATQLLPRQGAGALNQALMELGSEVCTPQRPDCGRCPLAPLCPTRAAGLQQEIPRTKKKTVYERVREACVVVWHRERLLLRRCGDDERWAGLWDFPRFPLQAHRGAALERELAAKVARLTGVTVRPGSRLTTIQHGVTRFRITLSCYEAEYVSGRVRRGQLAWARPAELNDYPLNVTGRRIGQQLVARDRPAARA